MSKRPAPAPAGSHKKGRRALDRERRPSCFGGGSGGGHASGARPPPASAYFSTTGTLKYFFASVSIVPSAFNSFSAWLSAARSAVSFLRRP